MADFDGLLNDVLFQDYASIRFINAADYGTELNILRDENMEIIELIENELSK